MVTNLALIFLFLCCLLLGNFSLKLPASSLLQSSTGAQIKENQGQYENIQFDAPDLVVDHYILGIGVTLEAFKIKNSVFPKWISFGYPVIVKNDRGQIFHISEEHVSVYMRALDDAQKEALAEQAKLEHSNESITKKNIIRFTYINFSCHIAFQVNEILYKIQSAAADFSKNPFQIIFHLKKGSEKQTAFKTRIQMNTSLNLECEFVVAGKKEKTNVLKINSRQMQDLRVADKLMGTGNETYVVRDQLSNLAQEIKSSLDIEEIYELENDDFSEEFIEKIMQKLTFEPVQIDEALAKLSHYGTQMDRRDLNANVIKQELQDVFKVKTDGGKKRIVAKKESDESNKSKDDTKVGIKYEAEAFSFASVKGQVDVTKNKENEWATSSATLDDQLTEINTHGQSGIKWEIQGERVIPKSLDVAKVSRMTLNQDMTFTRIRKRISNAKYAKTYVMNTDREVEKACDCSQIKDENAAAPSQSGQVIAADDAFFWRVAESCRRGY